MVVALRCEILHDKIKLKILYSLNFDLWRTSGNIAFLLWWWEQWCWKQEHFKILFHKTIHIALRLGNHVYCTIIFTFFVLLYLKRFLCDGFEQWCCKQLRQDFFTHITILIILRWENHVYYTIIFTFFVLCLKMFFVHAVPSNANNFQTDLFDPQMRPY